MEKTFLTKQSIPIYNETQKLENKQQDKVKIILLDVY